jgi:ATP-dependent DNA helicase DinG
MQSEFDAEIDKSSDIFALQGPFSKLIDGYQPRAGQQEMARCIENAILSNTHKVLEAPSGSGKTLAYLAPVIAAGQKTIVSTATQYLQTQLYRNDIPLIQKALGTSRRICVLRGRSSYLCPYYLQKSLNRDRGIAKNIRNQLATLWQRYRRTSNGLWSELLPSLKSSALTYATCSTEACLGRQCPQYSSCPLMRVRERAKNADIVIVNHSLLFSDHLMRKEQFTDFLPAADVVIVDEAHRLAEFAQTLVGHYLTSRQLKAYCRDALDTITQVMPDQITPRDYIKRLDRVVHRLGKSTPSVIEYERDQHVGIISQLNHALGWLSRWLMSVSERAQSLRELQVRTTQLKNKLQTIQYAPGVCWVEATLHGFVLQNIPVNLSGLMPKLYDESSATWIFTSATLSIEGNADKFLHLLGLNKTNFNRVSSCIDYQANAGLYTPRLPVDPGHSEYTQHLVEHALELIERVNGRVLFLFASHDMLQKTAALLSNACSKALFVQGVCAHHSLIEQFRQSEDGVLLGTGSFWEGLDLSGASLSCVIIDKLPFASPADPLVKLRTEELAAHGVDGFRHYQLPDAVIRLRQGCGRLLRRINDKGVIMLADPRLHSKSYGAVFINSLPTMTRSDTLGPLNGFLGRH